MTHISRCLASASLLAGAALAAAQDMELFQSSFEIDGATTANTEHGLAHLTYQGGSSLQFLNVAVGGVWAIQDAPVFS